MSETGDLTKKFYALKQIILKHASEGSSKCFTIAFNRHFIGLFPTVFKVSSRKVGPKLSWTFTLRDLISMSREFTCQIS